MGTAVVVVGTVGATVVVEMTHTAALLLETIIEEEITRHLKEEATHLQDEDLKALLAEETIQDPGPQSAAKIQGRLKVGGIATIDYSEKTMKECHFSNG